MIEVNGAIILTPIYNILCDLRNELRFTGSSILSIIKPQRDGDIIVSCPVHKDGLEQHPSASITVKEKRRGDKIIPAGFLHCFSCHAKMPIDKLISHCFGYKDNGAFGNKWLLDHYANYEIENRSQFFNKIERNLPVEVSFISDDELSKYRYTHPYMYKRGLTDDLIDKFDIGYDAAFKITENSMPFNAITFPVRDVNGKVNFIARRAIDTKTFHYDKGTHKLIYGLYEINKYFPDTKELFICESIFNALTLWNWGLPAVALFGTGSKDQYKTLKDLQYRKYILALDNDVAGLKGIKRLINSLKYDKILNVLYILESNKDINDLHILEKDEFLAKSKIYSQKEFLDKFPEI